VADTPKHKGKRQTEGQPSAKMSEKSRRMSEKKRLAKDATERGKKVWRTRHELTQHAKKKSSKKYNSKEGFSH
jgi:hypothetical protein